MGQFGIGQPMRRVEDARFLTGGGQYVDDIRPPGAARAYVLRSPYAHAEFTVGDMGAARAMPGVLGIFTAQDLADDGIGDLTCQAPQVGKGGSDTIMPPRPVLARERVRHVGDPIAFVVAETLAQAKDAAEAIEIDFQELPVNTDTAAAAGPAAPQIWPQAPNNVCVDWELGDAKATAAAFAKAAHVASIDIVNNRVVVNSLEPRGAIGSYDPATRRFELNTPSQGVHSLKTELADQMFHLPADQFRVRTSDVGGAFGMKIFLYAEQVLVLWAARRLGRPVRWTGERGESFLSDSQGRDHITRAELAMDKDGRFLALRSSTTANLGAYLSSFAPYVPTASYGAMCTGLYKIPAVYVEVKCVFTNTVPVDAYRGAGRPEAAYMVERLVDAAAREIGLAPDEIRRRNFITPDVLPYKTATGTAIDSGNFADLMARAQAAIGWPERETRRAKAKADGKLHGMSLACYVEKCAGVGMEDARVVLDADGSVTVYIGTQTNGQGHHTAYVQILTDVLGLPPEMIRTRQGDSDDLDYGRGTGGSRSLLMGGQAIKAAADKAIDRARSIAGHLLEAAVADIEFRDGAFAVVGTDRRVTWSQVAQAVHGKSPLPEALRGPIDEVARYNAPAMTFPNGCHACEVEVDAETGKVRIVRYVVMDDFGKLFNPLLVAGQVHGGTVQGVGQALLEHTVYDPDSGQLLSGSLMDYCLPRADDLPQIEVTLVEDFPCVTNPMGVKGAGEAGAVGACPAVINAVIDALSPLGVRHMDMPATPERVWRAIQDGRAHAPS